MEIKLKWLGIDVSPGSGTAHGAGTDPNAAIGKEFLQIAGVTPDEALLRLDTSLDGLLDREADDRLERYGPNEVAHEKHKGTLRRLFKLFLNPLSILLLGLAAVSYATGEGKSAIVISSMVVLSSLLSFVQEFQSSKAAERLRAMVSTTATVLRKDIHVAVSDGIDPYFQGPSHLKGPERKEIPLTHVVPGDIVHLSAGDIVPADVRVLAARDLFLNQASLTVESLPVKKFAGPVTGATQSALELNNVAFMGTNIVSGTAAAVVIATRPRTYFGSIASQVSGQRVLTEFDRGIDRFICSLLSSWWSWCRWCSWSMASPRATGWKPSSSRWRSLLA